MASTSMKHTVILFVEQQKPYFCPLLVNTLQFSTEASTPLHQFIKQYGTPGTYQPLHLHTNLLLKTLASIRMRPVQMKTAAVDLLFYILFVVMHIVF